MRRISTVAAILVLAASLANAQDDKKELEKFKGNWTVAMAERGGDKVPEEITKEMKVSFSEDKFTLSAGQGDRVAKFAIDATKKPRTIDLTPTDGPKKDMLLKGIYELDGDTLKLCIPDEATANRPTEFASPLGSANIFLTLKRTK